MRSPFAPVGIQPFRPTPPLTWPGPAGAPGRAATRGEDFNRRLLRYGIERLLPRFGLRQGPKGQFNLLPGEQRRHRLNNGISVLPDAPRLTPSRRAAGSA